MKGSRISITHDPTKTQSQFSFPNKGTATTNPRLNKGQDQPSVRTVLPYQSPAETHP